MQISGLPAPSLNFSKNGTALAGPSRPSKINTNQLSIHETSSLKGKERAVELDDREYSRPLTKREKANVSSIRLIMVSETRAHRLSNRRKLHHRNYGQRFHQQERT